MRYRDPCLIFALVSLLATGLSAQPSAPKVDFPAPSPAATLKQRVGLTDIEIEYSRPGVKGRVIFGGLEPWGETWRAGANSATKITFSTAVKVGGTEIPAGSYGLFTLLGQREWTVILNKIANQWGAYKYDPKDDVVRVKATPVTLATPVETFTIDINDIRDESATLDLTWEKTRVSVPLAFDVVGPVVAQIEAAIASPDKKTAGFYSRAADFYSDHNFKLEQAVAWMDAAIATQPDSFYLNLHKARIQAKLGDKAGAIATARHSMELAAKDTTPARDEYTRLNQALIDSLK